MTPVNNIQAIAPDDIKMAALPLCQTFTEIAPGSSALTIIGKDRLFHLMMGLEKTDFYRVSETCKYLFVHSRCFCMYRPLGEGRACAFLSNYEIRTAIVAFAQVHFEFVKEKFLSISNGKRTEDFLLCEFNLNERIAEHAKCDSIIDFEFYAMCCNKIYEDVIPNRPQLFSQTFIGQGAQEKIFRGVFNNTKTLITEAVLKNSRNL